MFASIFGRTPSLRYACSGSGYSGLRCAWSCLQQDGFAPLLSLALLVLPFLANAQYKYDYQWVIGYDLLSGSSGKAILNFNQSPIHLDSSQNNFYFETANTSICDENGNLVFYSDGCQIADASHEVMQGGEEINPGWVHDEYCDFGYIGSLQSMMSLPSINNEEQFSIFHILREEVTGQGILATKLLASTIDMNGNAGLGEAINTNTTLFENSFSSGELCAVKHADTASWWVLLPLYNSDKYLTFRWQADTVAEYFIQAVGDSMKGRGNGNATFSPDGTKYARYDNYSSLQIFDFDRSTGLFNNPQQIVWDDSLNWGSCAFSGSGRYLYVSEIVTVQQFDMQADDIAASRVEVAVWDGFRYLGAYPTSMFQMMRGPDCRIYITTASSSPYLGVIAYPDRPGLACDVRQHHVFLPAWNFLTIPYHPNYRLDTEYPTCDSSIALVVQALPAAPPPPNIEVWPNPASTHTTLQGHIPPQVREVSVRVYSASGQVVYRAQVATPGDTLHTDIDVSVWPSGVYTYQVISTDGTWGGGGRVVVMR